MEGYDEQAAKALQGAMQRWLRSRPEVLQSARAEVARLNGLPIEAVPEMQPEDFRIVRRRPSMRVAARGPFPPGLGLNSLLGFPDEPF